MASHSLDDFLREQLDLLQLEVKSKAAILLLIDHVDENGYLTEPLDRIADGCNGQFTVEDLESSLRILQGFKPSGVAARSLRECLTLQLNDNTPQYELVRCIISHHLIDAESGRLLDVLQQTNYLARAVEEAMSVLKSLDPKPGLQYVE